jgi:hypothetical protein
MPTVGLAWCSSVTSEAWDMVTSSRHPEPPMMIPASSSPRNDRPPTAKLALRASSLASPVSEAAATKAMASRAVRAEGEGGSDHGGGGLGSGSVGEVQRDQHDGHGPGDRDQDRAVAMQDGWDHEADDDHERQAQADQGTDALPAAEGDHGPDEQGGQDQQGPASFQVLDVVVGGLAGLLVHREAGALAGVEHPAGGVGGVEADLAAAGQPGGDLDAAPTRAPRVRLRAVEAGDLGQAGRDQPSGVGPGRPAPGLGSSPRGHRATRLASTARAITPTTASMAR